LEGSAASGVWIRPCTHERAWLFLVDRAGSDFIQAKIRPAVPQDLLYSRERLIMPLVSIITPVYNAARWLPETLATVRAQTLTDWEHILVDDCSTDGSAAIIEAAEADDARFRLLRAPRNAGPSAARNQALDAARGRFIAFLDADDVWNAEKLARSVDWMTRHGYGFIYHDYRHMSHDGAKVGALITGPEVLDLRTLHTRRGTGGCLSMVIDQEDSGLPLSNRFPLSE
jgi:glycosyltransferase involved in cell wall biosynthesis